MMNSPIFPSTPLCPQEIAPGLHAFLCPKSEGVWLPLQSYLLWLGAGRTSTEILENSHTPEIANDSNRKPLFCPESGAMLIRYRVGHGLKFQLDRSPLTGGIWFDKGEWDAIRAAGLDIELHRVFTAPYQKEIRDELHHEKLMESFKNRIGPSDFNKALEFRNWMSQHPNVLDIRAFILEREF